MLSLRDTTGKHYEEHRLVHQKLTKIYLAIRVHDSETLDRMFLDAENVKVLPLELKEDGALPTNSNEKCFFRPMKVEEYNRYPVDRKDPSNAQQLRIREEAWTGPDLTKINNSQPLFLIQFHCTVIRQVQAFERTRTRSCPPSSHRLEILVSPIAV